MKLMTKATLRFACSCAVVALANGTLSAAAMAQSAEALYDFDLPAQSLAQALRAYGRITHQQIVFDQDAIQGRQASAIKGRMTAGAALSRLLDGSGLSVRHGVNGIIIIGGGAAVNAGPAADSGAGDGDIVVTGTFIPGVDTLLPMPVTHLTQAQLTQRGFTSVADAVQKSPFSTGAVVGSDTGYTQGARTASLFSLGPDYTKYLIDGHPMGIFPALYNNQTNFVDLSSLPAALIDSVDILPGGQSSLYGADAVAGVVNVKLKKKLDGPVVSVRRGFTQHGGDSSWRLSGADSFTFGKFNLLVGAQYDAIKPLWGFQRRLTSTPFEGNPSSPAVPDQAASLISATTFGFVDIPSTACDSLASLYGNGVAYYNDGAGSVYCGNSHTGYKTITNDEHRLNVYAHATYDLNDHTTFYADVLAGHAISKFGYAQAYAYYYSAFDGITFPVAGSSDDVYAVRYFSPEERGGLDNLLSREKTDTLHLSTGARGQFGNGDWNYDFTYVHNHQSMVDQRKVTLTEPMEAYFNSILSTGGLDAFFSPIPTDTVSSFYATAVTKASSNSNWARALVANGHLFPLPGGDAGIALAVEGGREGWRYTPDPGYAEQIYYYDLTDVSGDGSRNNAALMGETRLPVLQFLTLSGSARYDRFFVHSVKTGKVSYNIGAELTPLPFLTLRGRYGTAFKAPTLADLFQGPSSVLAAGIDYRTCVEGGVALADCSNSYTYYRPYTQTMSGNTELKPLTARVFDVGAVLQPTGRIKLSADVLHWDIRNGVAQDSTNTILRDEALCVEGSSEVDDARCAQVSSYITRDSNGNLVSVYSPKVNVTRQKLTALVMSGSADFPAGDLGDFQLAASYTLFLKRTYQSTPDSAVYDALSNPLYVHDFRSRINASLSWTRNKLSATLYADRVSKIANYAATYYGTTDEAAGLLPAQVTLNLGMGYKLNSHFSLSANINNLLDSGPPVDNSYTSYADQTYNSSLYSIIGRSFQLQANYEF